MATERGDIEADYVVNCAGMWAREVGLMGGVNVPLHACEHFYVVTEPTDMVPPDLPVLRDMDGCAYYKEDAGKLLIGAFEHNARPWGMDGIPEDHAFEELPEDLDHFAPVLEGAMHRVPALERVGIRTFFNGPESFTPDVRYHIGEAPELRNFFVLAGFNSIGIQSSGGAGKALAEWIVGGEAPFDLSELDLRRMQPFQNSKTYLFHRVAESLGTGVRHALAVPAVQRARAEVRKSPLHGRLEALGACFGEVGRLGTAQLVRARRRRAAVPIQLQATELVRLFPRPSTGPVREAVGLFDQTSFAKFLVQGRDAEAVLQRICANDVAVPVDRVVYTQWLNDKGGIEADLTVVRLAETAFMVVTGAAAAVHDHDWLMRHIPYDANVTVTDADFGLCG